MNNYIITIRNDTQQQLVFKANSVSEALDKAKIAFKESMVTSLDDGIKHKPLSEYPRVIHLSPENPTAYDGPSKKELREQERQRRFNEIPD